MVTGLCSGNPGSARDDGGLSGDDPITRRFAEQFGVAGRYEYNEGDLRQVDFGRDLYDLVILGHIIHSEGEKHGRDLIRKSHAALKRAGKLLIAEFVPNDARTGPPMPVMFGLNMLLHTEEGDVFTMREYRSWLKDAGFGSEDHSRAPAVNGHYRNQVGLCSAGVSLAPMKEVPAVFAFVA